MRVHESVRLAPPGPQKRRRNWDPLKDLAHDDTDAWVPPSHVAPPPPVAAPVVVPVVAAAAATASSSSSSSSAFPPSLRRLGNADAWTKVRGHLSTIPSVPLMLSGPTGCGKTVGVTCLLESMGLLPVILDSVEADDTEQLVVWIKRTRDSNSMLGKRAVVVDDVEGFTDKGRLALAGLIKDSTTGRAPLILIVNNARDPMWKRLGQIATIRLTRPSEHVCHEWFSQHHTWTTVDSTGHEHRRRGISDALLASSRSVLSCGDLRRMAVFFNTSILTRSVARLSNDVFPANAFDSSRRLFRGTLTADRWASFAEPRDVALLQHHTIDPNGDLRRATEALDVFSFADAQRPLRYEHMGSFDHWNAHLVAESTRTFTNQTRDVGSLCPPPRTTPESRPRETDDPIDALNRHGFR